MDKDGIFKVKTTSTASLSWLVEESPCPRPFVWTPLERRLRKNPSRLFLDKEDKGENADILVTFQLSNLPIDKLLSKITRPERKIVSRLILRGIL